MNLLKILTDYLRSVQSELRKVSWPSQRDTIRYSAIVIGISLITGAFFATLDYEFNLLSRAGIAARDKYISRQITPAPSTVQTTSTKTPPAAQTNPKINFNDVTPITTPASGTTKTIN